MIKKATICKRYNKILLPFFLLPIIALLFTACGGNPANGSASADGDAAADTAVETNSPAVPASPSGTASMTNPYSYGQNTISVNSSEKVAVIPDIAEIIYAVRTEAGDASACQKKNTEDVNHVVELLKGLGVEESSIQTSDYYMYPIYNYSGNVQRITGYEASTSLTVSGLPISNLGEILAKSVDAGINNIQSITYQSSQYDQAYADALRLAMGSAQSKAEALAEAGGCSLGAVAGVRENSNYSEARYTDNALSAQVRNSVKMMAEAAEDYSSNVMPGEVQVEVNITVEYFIR